MVAEALYKPFAFIAKEKEAEKSRGSRMKSMGIVDKNTRNGWKRNVVLQKV